jgi:outer membrane protein
VLLDAVSAHMNVVRDQQIIAIRSNNVEVLAEQLRAARDRFEVGEITRTDVAQAEARLSGARAQLSAAQAALAASRAGYARVTGVDPSSLSAPDLPSRRRMNSPMLRKSRSAAIPDLLAAQFQNWPLNMACGWHAGPNCLKWVCGRPYLKAARAISPARVAGPPRSRLQ